MNYEEGKQILEYVGKISEAKDEGNNDGVEAFLLLLEQYVLEKMERKQGK